MKTFEVYIPGAKDPFIIKALLIQRDEKEGLVFISSGGISQKTGKGYGAPIAYAPKDSLVYVIEDTEGGPVAER